MATRPSQLPHAATGIVSLAMLLATVPVLPPIPAFGSSESEIAAFYASHATRGYVYQFMAGLALLAAMWFLGYACTRLRREVPASPLPLVMLAAGAAWAGFAIVFLGLFQIFSVWAEDPGTHAMLRALSDAYVLGFMFNVFPAALMVAAGSWCMRPSEGWPAYLKPLGILALAAQALGSVPLLAPTGPLKAGGVITYASFFMVLLWLCTASVAATRWERSGAGGDREARPAAALAEEH